MPHQDSPNENDLLFRLLTEEIKDRHDADKLKGWTPWLLFAALASMASVLVEEIWSRPLRVEAVRACFIIGSLGIVSLTAGRAFLAAITEKEGGRPRFLFLEGTPTSMACWFGAMSAACFLHRSAVSSYSLTAMSWFLAFFSVMCGVIVLVRAAKVPIPANRRPIIPRLIVFGALFGLGVSSIDVVLRTPVVQSLQLGEVKVGGMLAIGAFLMMLLGGGSRSSSDTKDILVQLRQDLVLGNITASEGRDRARTALQGMFLSETVNDDVNALLKFISDVRAIYADALQTAETLKGAVPISTPDAARPTDFQKLAIANALDLLVRYEQRARQIGQQYFKKLRRVRGRLRAMSRLVKAAASDEANLMSQIKVAQTPADEDLERFVAAFEEIQAAWNYWFPAEQRQHKPFDGAHFIKF